MIEGPFRRDCARIVSGAVGSMDGERLAVDLPGVPVSVIVCTHNRCHLLPGVVGSLLSQLPGESCIEILVVANACTDDTSRIVDQLRDAIPLGVTLRQINEETLGLSWARNRGLQEASHELIAFLDDDAIALPGWLAAIQRAFLLSPSIGVVGGPVLPDWPGASPPRWLDDSILGYFSILDHGPRVRRLFGSDDWLAGANIAFRRSCLMAVGGFSTRLGRCGGFLLSSEEYEAMCRLTEAGSEAWYCPTMRVLHRIHPERMSRQWLLRRAFWQGVSDVIVEQPEEVMKLPSPSDAEVNRALLIRLGGSLLGEFLVFDLLGCRSCLPRLAQRARSLGRRYALASTTHRW